MKESNRQTIHTAAQFSEALRLAMEIQNAGIATAFFQFNAHINTADVDLHTPIWVLGVKASRSLKFYGADSLLCSNEAVEHNESTLAELRKILATGERMSASDAVAKAEKEKAIADYEKAQARYDELFQADKAA